jgi:pyrroline-5-carboxylate reductase
MKPMRSFILGACAAFVSYLINKAKNAGLRGGLPQQIAA